MLCIPQLIGNGANFFRWNLDIRSIYVNLLHLAEGVAKTKLIFSSRHLADIDVIVPDENYLQEMLARLAHLGRLNEAFVAVTLVLHQKHSRSGKVDHRLWALLRRLAELEMKTNTYEALSRLERSSFNPELMEEWSRRASWAPPWVEDYLKRRKAETGRQWILSERTIAKINKEQQYRYELLLLILDQAQTDESRCQAIKSWIGHRQISNT
ncbi:MAG: hypothetical protein HYX20_00750 [Candidatus Yanofskybacteria bacterium]|nr:hypothetical protein [Candidatus Yanofskybacteria bacterium]